MKKLLLTAALFSAAFGYSQTYDANGTYLINEIIPSPPNPNDSNLVNYTDNTVDIADHQYDPDNTLEYFEFRGTPGATIEDDVYFIAIEGDGESGKTDMGEVKDAIDLSGLTFGNNGVLTIVSNITFDPGSVAFDGTTDISGTKIINPYAAALASSDGSVLTIELTGTPDFITEDGVETLDRFNNVSKTRGYDGTINDQSGTYMIVKSPDNDPNSADVDIDMDNDGIIDDATVPGADMTHLNWIIYDSMSILDDDDQVTDGSDTGEYAYGQIIFYDDALVVANDATNDLFFDASISTLVPLEDDANYFARISDDPDYVGGVDWSAGRINSGTQPEWTFSGTAARSIPQTLASTSLDLSTFGGLNTGQTITQLSTNDFAINGTTIGAGPVPMQETLNINGVEAESVTIYSLNGGIVAKGTQTVDVASLSAGPYILEVTSDGKTATTIVVK